jgi:hypothetical protein
MNFFPNVRNGRKTVTSAGTAERLVSTNTPAKKVTIMAELDNGDYVVIGGSTVVAALGTRQGIALSAGSSITLENIEDLYDIWIDAVVSTEGVTFLYQF